MRKLNRGPIIIWRFVLVLTNVFGIFIQSNAQKKIAPPKYSAYLFVYFTGNNKNEEAIHFALSKDAYNFSALNGDNPVLSSNEISSTGGVRDPHIVRSVDGKTFYMVATDMVSGLGWSSNRAMVLLKSTNLINWTSSVINIQKRFAGNDSLLRVWAPQTIFDPTVKKYMIYWSMKYGKNPDKIYYAYVNDTFTDLDSPPKQLFFSPTDGACIDGEIILKNGKYHLFFKTEGEGSGIKVAVSNKLTSGFVLQDQYVQQTTDPVEGASVFKLNNGDGYILMYDVYTKGKYQFTKTRDLKHFEVVDKEVTMNFHPRHGTVLPITAREAKRLENKWGSALDVIGFAQAKQIKKLNTSIDTVNKAIHLSVKPGTKLNAFDPLFIKIPGIQINPSGPQDFIRNPILYTITIQGHQPEKWKVDVKKNHNPILDGYYADPDFLFSEKNKKFYIYPTSDGYTHWSSTFFKTFSSSDLINWKDEGVILDLNKDVTWAKKNAWAPCIIEKKVGNSYKYFFYYTAGQKIGVAVADDPTGPFVDKGTPLIDRYPTGIYAGQQIDPEVFTDPKTQKCYLYWGNGYLACAELNKDMLSLKNESIKVITPNKKYREGTTVFYRGDKYYFLWSEDDTRSENYKVCYGTANSPQGDITVPLNNLVVAKDTSLGIYATGHNTILQIPGKDEWYIVYHRFNYPNGINMGKAAGYNREICIDRLEFNADGTIIQVKPTHLGIKSIK